METLVENPLRLHFLYEARLKYLRDQLSNIIGECRVGREEEQRKIAKRMLEEGFPIEMIVKLTKLSEEEIRGFM